MKTTADNLPSPITTTLHRVKIIARTALGLVWLYEGLVPKILYLGAYPEQIELVRRSGLYWRTPTLTLVLLGIAQAITGIVLLLGWAERTIVLLATLGMAILILLVATGRPAMLTDPYGALVKDLCLLSCALTVWLLAPLLDSSPRSAIKRQ